MNKVIISVLQEIFHILTALHVEIITKEKMG
jgi:hypothetical protein